MTSDTSSETQFLILAPTGRDAHLLSETLLGAEIASLVTDNLVALLSALDFGAAALMIAEEALPARVIEQLAERLGTQEPWSDLPILVLTSGGRANSASSQRADQFKVLGNVTLMERPVRPDTVLSAARAALRARLRQYEMRRRQAALTRVNMDLEQFAYSASHDLQEPLRNIAVYSELIARRYGPLLDEQGTEFLGYLRSGAVRMQNLVHDLLAYTQAASSSEDDVLEPVDANDPLRRALDNLSEAIRQSSAVVVAADLPLVRIKPVHLQQLFQNLVGNALKYRRAEPPRIEISVTRAGEFWQFSVKDNGIGISREHRDRVFGLFKRLHTSEQYDGTGIGLAICRRIVERSRGQIWVESELGSGSEFLFTLLA